jgi:glutamyl-tRNA reductase
VAPGCLPVDPWSATRSEAAIRAAWLEERAVRWTGDWVVDLGAPRSVETPTADVPALRIFDLATLSVELQADSAGRIDAVHGAEAIVEEELSSWVEWVQTRLGGAVRCGVPRRGELVG